MLSMFSKNFLSFKSPSAHSNFSPSSFERWGACPASIKLSEGIELPKQSYTEEGSVAHLLCEAVFDLEINMIPIPPHVYAEVSKFPEASNLMWDSAYRYVGIIRELCLKVGEVRAIYIEKKIPILEECWGTSDCIIVGTKATIILDFKFGAKFVKPSSKQIGAYLVGIVRHLNFTIPEGYQFFGAIHQPKVSQEVSIHEWSLHSIEEIISTMMKAFEEAKNPNAQPVLGEHCFWCPANRTTDPTKKCPAVLGKVTTLRTSSMMENFKRINSPDTSVRNEAARELFLMKDFIIQTLNELEDEFKYRLLEGESIKGIQLVNEEGRREWVEKDTAKLNSLVKSRFPSYDITKIVPEKVTLKTLAEVTKELGAEVVSQLTQKKITKTIKIDDESASEIISRLLTSVQR